MAQGLLYRLDMQARRQGGSVGSDEPPRLPNGPLEVFRKLLYWPLLTPQIAVTSSVEDCSNTAALHDHVNVKL